jgi:hypothetical protein
MVFTHHGLHSPWSSPTMVFTHSKAQVEFLRAEAELSLSFVRIASQSRELEKARRLRELAKKGYQTLNYFMDRIYLTREEHAELTLYVSRLRLGLQNLGERV